MKKEYQYPLDLDWTMEEMMIVTEMWTKIEEAYENGVNTKEFLSIYEAFKKVVPSIAEEKKLGKKFEEVSGYSLYRSLQAAKTSPKARFNMNT